MRALLFLVSFIVLASCRIPNLRPIVNQILVADGRATMPPPPQKRSMEQMGPPDNMQFTTCTPTFQLLETWQQFGDTTPQLIGNWTGFAFVDLYLRNSPNPPVKIGSQMVPDIWNISYNETGGYIDWVDTINNLPPDRFKRYLQNPFPHYKQWSQCTDVSSSQTSNFVDFELNAFHFTSQSSVLKQKVAPYGTAASCDYVLSADGTYAEVMCMNLEPLGFFPPGITAIYYEVMNRN